MILTHEPNEILSLTGDTKGQKAYIPISDVIDELDKCLDNIKNLLDYY